MHLANPAYFLTKGLPQLKRAFMRVSYLDCKLIKLIRNITIQYGLAIHGGFSVRILITCGNKLSY